MKNCSNCKYLCRDGYEDYYYICELFGEDIPDWANHPNDECCLLKSQEVNKMIKLSNDFLIVGTGKVNPKTFYTEWTEEDKKHNEIAKKNYDNYIELLKKRCEERKIDIFAKEIAKEIAKIRVNKMTLKDFIGIIDSNTTCYFPSDDGRYDYREVISFQHYIIYQNMEIERIRIIGENEVLIYLKDSE